MDTFDSGKKTSEFIAEQDRILAEDVVSGAERFWPVHVYLEPTNHCNLRCSMCARSAMDRGVGTMPLDRFKGVLDEIAELGIRPRITLTGQGEPLIDRTLMDKIGHAVSRGVHVSIITNGTLLDERRTEALLNSGIHRVQISFDSLIPETYGRIRIPAVGTGADLFAATKARVERFIRANLSRPEPIFVSISAVISDLNRQEVDAMRTHWTEVGVDNVYFPDVTVRSGLGGYDSPEARQRIRRCSMPFRTMGIMWDGNVRTCTGAPNSDFSGNVFTQGFEAVWRQGSRRGRRLVAARDWTALEALQVCCAQCDINDQLPSLSELGQSRPGHSAADKFLMRQEEIGRTRPMGE